jgi:hypothetical protein
VIEKWRQLTLYLLLLGVSGVAAELILLEHYEDPWQWTPIALLVGGGVVGTAVAVRPSKPLIRTLRAVMAAYVLAAGLGVFFHLKANVEFERELRPSIGGSELIVETLKGAMPALAPGAMAQLGLLGLLATYKHPKLNPRTSTDDESA